ncbi:MAG: GNAT family N-acetyltransferase [Chloroflexota bacterium]|nr:GNAT family N-acetyltransferase [Chloroflexota bacterium]
MSLETKIVEITAHNISKHPQAICFINPKHEFYHKKIDWLNDQFKNGLRIKLLYLDGEKKPIGFIEYVPGESCWRAVNAKGYMFIHCLWTNGKKYQHQGLGTLLIQEVEQDAKDMMGIAVVTSDKSFMANKGIFTKNGYKTVAESGKEQLIVKSFKEGPLPSINNWESKLNEYRGLTILYSAQCPWVARFMEEVKPILDKEGLEPRIIELTNASEAQQAPSVYGVFNLIYNGRLLSDRYISTTRFLNIVKNEIKRQYD